MRFSNFQQFYKHLKIVFYILVANLIILILFHYSLLPDIYLYGDKCIISTKMNSQEKLSRYVLRPIFFLFFSSEI